MCRSVMYLYSELKLEVDQKLLSLAGILDTSMECPACPVGNSGSSEDRQYITMDGNFSQKCKKEETEFDRDNRIPLLEEMRIKKEVIEGINNVAPSEDVSSHSLIYK
ncbi:unnamed protein product [Mucor hiemalis]